MSEFIQINVKDLIPHPDNPRKNLGDLSELTESIRINGILQNLTVVQDGDKYKVIIGHRRLAAAQAAGLTELPCMVADMDERQQLCAMMEENMQRQDLTVPEQAYGFQYMLDLGETVESIAKKTGFSETTVRHRLEIAKLSKKVVKYADKYGAWQMSIKDYIELERVKNIKSREKIIKDACSHQHFQNLVEQETRIEKRKEALEKWKPLLAAAGVEKAEKDISPYDGRHERVRTIDLDREKVPKKLILKDYNKNEPLFWTEQYGDIYILQKKGKGEKKQLTKEALEQKEKEKKRKALGKKSDAMIKEMQLCARAVFEGKIDEPDAEAETDVMQELWGLLRDTNVNIRPRCNITVLSDKKNYWDLDKEEEQAIWQQLSKKRLSTQLLVLMSYEWSNFIIVRTWDGYYSKEQGEHGMRVYNTLHDIYGFTFSDPEYMKVLDGTHEDYKRDK